jgi:hypothetical protein
LAEVEVSRVNVAGEAGGGEQTTIGTKAEYVKWAETFSVTYSVRRARAYVSDWRFWYYSYDLVCDRCFDSWALTRPFFVELRNILRGSVLRQVQD